MIWLRAPETEDRSCGTRPFLEKKLVRRAVIPCCHNCCSLLRGRKVLFLSKGNLNDIGRCQRQIGLLRLMLKSEIRRSLRTPSCSVTSLPTPTSTLLSMVTITWGFFGLQSLRRSARVNASSCSGRLASIRRRANHQIACKDGHENNSGVMLTVLHRVWPVASLALALIATAAWMGLLGYVLIKLF